MRRFKSSRDASRAGTITIRSESSVTSRSYTQQSPARWSLRSGDVNGRYGRPDRPLESSGPSPIGRQTTLGSTRSSGRAGCEKGRSDAAIRCATVRTVESGSGGVPLLAFIANASSWCPQLRQAFRHQETAHCSAPSRCTQQRTALDCEMI